KRSDLGACGRIAAAWRRHRGAAGRLPRARRPQAGRWRGGREGRPPACHGVRGRGPRRRGAVHHPRRGQRRRLVSGVLLPAPVVAGVRTDKVYLVGFMGAGKSTVARALARRIGWRVEDVDERIEARERRSVAAIFEQQGEPYFRQVEREVLQELLPLREVVVATGG